MIDSERFHVGLALFDSTNNIDFPGENLISAGGPMKWIALLPPSQMQNEDIRQMILENFYDYHTLPCRQQTPAAHSGTRLRHGQAFRTSH